MLQFVREIPIRIVIQGALSARRGFLFHLAAGFSGEVDPLSGMSVNLMLLDEWLWQLKKDLEQDIFQATSESFNHTFAEIMAIARLRLTEKAEEQGVRLASLVFREERGATFSWDLGLPPEQMQFTSFQFIECVPRDGQFQLLRLGFTWLRLQSCEADYAHESFRILKTLSFGDVAGLYARLSGFLGMRLDSGSSLLKVSVENTEDGSKVIL
ncbi:MAG: hypothetical protein HUU57_15575 [Bdellovibrio sp.]|nr:hypothetical protein [Bdellovibrio sp.]